MTYAVEVNDDYMESFQAHDHQDAKQFAVEVSRETGARKVTLYDSPLSGAEILLTVLRKL